MKKLLFLLVSFLMITNCFAGKWDYYKNSPYNTIYSVSEDGNMYCTLSKEFQTEVGDIPSQRSFTVYTDAADDIQVNLTGDSRFQLTKNPTVTEAYSTYARAYIYYTFDVAGLEPSSTPHTATITITRGDQVVTCSLSEAYIPEPDPTAGPVLNGEFSVSATQRVKFTRGNLYWDGNDWAMESAQERYKKTWDANHIGLLYWGSAEQAIATSSSYSETQLFCDGSDNAHKLTLEDAEGLYAMDKDQWNYLLFTRTNASNLCKYPVTVNGISSCMVIAPDNYEGTIEASYSQSNFLAAQENGLVCLPPPGTRYGTTIYSGASNSYFHYWTSTIDIEAYFSAYSMHATEQNDIEVTSGYYTSCYGIRLVQDVANDPSGCAHANLTRHDSVESTDLVQGHSAYDQCDDCGACFATDDTEHENPLTAADFLLPIDISPINYFYIQNLEGDDTEVYWIGDVALQYSYDKTTWTNSTKEDPLPANGKIYYRATTRGNTAFNPGENGFVVRTGWTRKNYAVGGDITTLIRSNGKVSTLPAPTNDYGDYPRGIFEGFFNNDGYLLDASALVLPSTTLSDHCYYEMFFGCRNLSGATPTINAVTMAPYSCMGMFSGCSSLTTATDLQVETMAEYSCAEMFSNCTYLQNAPAIPTTIVAAHSCEYMFHDCESMTTAPAILPATTLAVDCYNRMFYGCSNITTAPELPATSLVDGCYVQMFYGCSNLNYIKVGLMTDWPMTVTYNETEGYNEYDYPCTRQWVYGVSETGTFNGNTCLFKDIFPGPDGYTSTVPSKRYEKVFWTSENPLIVPVTISSVGYSTFCYDYNWIIPEGTEGYIAYVNDNGYLCFEKGFDAGDVVNSYRSAYQTYEDGQMIEQWVCKAVVLKGAPGTYTVQLTSREAIGGLEESVDKNALYGSMHDFDISLFHTLQDDNTGIINSDYYYYALSLDENGENVGFYWMLEDGAPFVTKPYKAFLRAMKNNVGQAARQNALTFDDAITTGIEQVNTTPAIQLLTTDGIYDLSGRRVKNANKGIFIINNHKVVK